MNQFKPPPQNSKRSKEAPLLDHPIDHLRSWKRSQSMCSEKDYPSSSDLHSQWKLKHKQNLTQGKGISRTSQWGGEVYAKLSLRKEGRHKYKRSLTVDTTFRIWVCNLATWDQEIRIHWSISATKIDYKSLGWKFTRIKKVDISAKCLIKWYLPMWHLVA